MGIKTGSVATIRGTLTNPAGTEPEDAPTGTLKLLLVAPTGSEKAYSEGEIEHDGVGLYHVDVEANISGLWHYQWTVEDSTVEEGTFSAESEFDQGEVPDLTDLRVLVPRARRACEGPYGPPDGKPELLNEQIYQMVADACSEIILYTGTLFGHELQVKKRDPIVGFPTDWKTEVMLSEWESAVIINQTGLNFVLHLIRDTKTAETIKDEGQEWAWQSSANLLQAQLKILSEGRDKAIEMLERLKAPLDSYISTVAERDKIAAIYLEPWVAEVGAPVPYSGLGGATQGGFDFRFGTWG
jgi:hypothetical protein